MIMADDLFGSATILDFLRLSFPFDLCNLFPCRIRNIPVFFPSNAHYPHEKSYENVRTHIFHGVCRASELPSKTRCNIDGKMKMRSAAQWRTPHSECCT